jgi:ASCH domain
MSRLRSILAISIRQPWAELILRGVKEIEIRSWDDAYRGDLYLHTGKRPDGYRILEFGMGELFLGGYVGVIEVAAIIPFSEARWEEWRPKHLDNGRFQSGLYAWIIRNPRRFQHPISAPGSLGIYEPAPDIAETLMNESLTRGG